MTDAVDMLAAQLRSVYRATRALPGASQRKCDVVLGDALLEADRHPDRRAEIFASYVEKFGRIRRRLTA